MTGMHILIHFADDLLDASHLNYYGSVNVAKESKNRVIKLR